MKNIVKTIILILGLMIVVSCANYNLSNDTIDDENQTVETNDENDDNSEDTEIISDENNKETQTNNDEESSEIIDDEPTDEVSEETSDAETEETITNESSDIEESTSETKEDEIENNEDTNSSETVEETNESTEVIVEEPIDYKSWVLAENFTDDIRDEKYTINIYTVNGTKITAQEGRSFIKKNIGLYFPIPYEDEAGNHMCDCRLHIETKENSELIVYVNKYFTGRYIKSAKLEGNEISIVVFVNFTN